MHEDKMILDIKDHWVLVVKSHIEKIYIATTVKQYNNINNNIIIIIIIIIMTGKSFKRRP